MRILFISHYSSKGGANNEMLWLSQALMERGHKIFVMIPEHGTFEDSLSSAMLPYIVINYKRWISTIDEKKRFLSRSKKIIYITVNNMIMAHKIAKYVKKNEIDIVHTNDSLDVVGCMAARLCRIPHVWHLREFLEEDYSRSIIYSENYIRKWFARSNMIVAISKAILNKYSSRITEGNSVVIYDGIKVPPQIPFEENKPTNGKMNILFMGGTNRGKGFEELLELAGLLKLQGLSFVINIAGNCHDKHKYDAAIMSKGIGDNIRYLGFVENVATEFRKNDIFLMMSKLEAFGLVTVEAMLNGTVVLGNASGGTVEILAHEETGFLYSNQDLEEACSILINIFNGKYDLNNIRKRAFFEAKKRFDIVQTASEIEKVYHSVLQKNIFD